ncbi:MAG: tetratricopeptide repeat protein [Candidatus Alkanophagales archaeon]
MTGCEGEEGGEMKDLIREFLGEEDEDILEAWRLYIEYARAASGRGGLGRSRMQQDAARRRLQRFLRERGLEMFDSDDGLSIDEIAIAGSRAEMREHAVNFWDVVLLAEYEPLCRALLSESPAAVPDLRETLLSFLMEAPEGAKSRFFARGEAAERVLRAVLDEEPAEINVRRALIDFYVRRGRLEDAANEYRRLLEVREEPTFWYGYASLLEDLGRYEEALRAYERSISQGVPEHVYKHVRGCMSRVEKLMRLGGESDDARRIREFKTAMDLMARVREFVAGGGLETEFRRAFSEYKAVTGRRSLSAQEVMSFIDWFAFERRLPNGETPATLYARMHGLDETIRDRLKNLQNSVSGVFEVVELDADTLKLVVRELVSDREYLVIADPEGVERGQTFQGKLVPWGDFYVVSSAVVLTKEASERLKETAERVRSGELLREVEEAQAEVHRRFVEFFGGEEALFTSRRQCERELNRFVRWHMFEKALPSGKTPARLYEERHGGKPGVRRVRLPPSFDATNDIGVISDPKHGIIVVPYYGRLKRLFETASDEELEAHRDYLKDALESVEPFVLKRLIESNVERAASIVSRIFGAELPSASAAGADREALKSEIFEVMRERRGADWDREPVMPLAPSSKYFPRIRVQMPA